MWSTRPTVRAVPDERVFRRALVALDAALSDLLADF